MTVVQLPGILNKFSLSKLLHEKSNNVGGLRTLIVQTQSSGGGGSVDPGDSFQANTRGDIAFYLDEGETDVYFESIGSVNYVVNAEAENYDGPVSWDVIAKAHDHFKIVVPVSCHIDWFLIKIL